MEYKKPPLTYEAQLKLLIDRGLAVTDKDTALDCLTNVSYYRLSAYYLPFKQGEDFKPDTNFKNIVDLYTFDRKLRLLVMDAIEPIEIALRSQIIYHLSHAYGAFGYIDKKNFSYRFKHDEWLSHLNKLILDSTEKFITHYRKKYTSSVNIPLWMALELVSFGGLSRLFRGMHGSDQQVISKKYDLQDTVLSSWLHTLVYVRNLCAHHARLWNRILTFKPKLPEKNKAWIGVSSLHIYAVLSIAQYLLREIDIDTWSAWKNKLFTLLQEHPHIPIIRMGFPSDWKTRSIWI